MDLFYETVKITQKKRIHFNEFMLDIHKDIHASDTKEDPIKRIGATRAKDTRLLCLDEF